MSQYNVSGHKGYVSDNALSRGYAVKLSSGKVVLASAATDKIIGVTTENSSAGATVDVRLRNAQGTSIGKAGGTIAVGDRLTSNAAGKLVATTTAADEVVGVALETAASGDLFEFMNANHLYAIT